MAISDQQIFDWFTANPNADDATIASTMDQFKLAPQDIARATGADLGNIQSRYDAVNAGGLNSLATPPADTTTATFAGQDYTLNNADINNVYNQIVGQGTMSQWTGEGFGSADANARAMAQNLVASGVTNINQIGQKEVVTPGYSYETEQGTVEVPESSQTVLFNTVTGQPLISDYDRATGNAWSGTFTGEGNTAYRVGFDAQGQPILYTTGASSSDVGDIQTLLAAASFIPGVAPFAQGLNAAISAGQGNYTGAILGALGAGQSAGFTDIGGIPITDAKSVVGGLNAIQTGNVAGLVNSATGYAGANLPSEVQTGLQIANAATALANSDMAGLVDAAGTLTGSSDAKLAASALRLTNAFDQFNNTGDPTALMNATQSFSNALNATKTGTTGSAAKVDDFVDNTTSNLATKDVASTVGDGATSADTLNLNGALENQIATTELDRVARETKLSDIANAKTFGQAFADARSLLGPNQTFTWNGKQYSTATSTERPDLSTPSIDALNARNLATTTNASQTVAAQSDTAARATAADELAKQQAAALKTTESTGFFSNLANSIQNQMKLSSEAANKYLKENPDSPITNSVSTALEAAGNLQKNVAGGTALLLNNKPLADSFVKSGDDLTKFGQSIGNGVVDTKNWNETMSLLQNASGLEKLGVMAGRILDGTSGLGRQVEVELRQELPGLFLGGGSVKGILLATGAMDVGETTGNAALETYDAAVKKGASHEQALSDARKAGATAGLTEAAIQLTLGKVADVVVGKIGNVAGKAGAKVTGETLVEGGQEAGAAAAVDAVLGNAFDANKYLTQGIAGAAVGKGTAVATTPADIAQSETINNAISTAVTTGDKAGVSTAITNSVQESLSSGASVDVAVGSSVSSAITAGADAESSITTAVGSAVESGADVSQTVSSAITSATTAGVEANTAITNSVNSAITASVTSGADVNTAVNSAVSSAVTTAVTNNANVNTAVTASVNSAVTAAITNNADVNTAITSSVTAAVNAAVTTNTNADVNVVATDAVTAAVTSAVNSGVDANVAVQTAINAITDIDTNIDIPTITKLANDAATKVTEKGDSTEVEKVSDTSSDKTTTSTTTAKTPAKTGKTSKGGAELSTTPSFGVDTKLSYKKVSEDAPILNPVLFSLAGVPVPSQTTEPTEKPLTDEEEKGTKEEDTKEAPALDLLSFFSFAEGGMVPEHPMGQPEFYSEGGAGSTYIQGRGDGTSDQIPAMVANSEYVLPADIVSALGNGSSDSGADILDQFIQAIRAHKHSNPPDELPPESKGPLEYLASVQMKGRK